MIRTDVFQGMNQRIDSRLLEPSQAVDAANARFGTGRLGAFDGLGAAEALGSTGTVKALHRFADAHWFRWTTPVAVVKGAIPGDTEERTYYSGDGAPKMTYAGLATASIGQYPTGYYLLGIPAPTATPTATISGTATDANDIPEDRLYVLTYVSAKGEEGPPSPASNIVEWKPGQTTELTNLAGAPTGNYNITRKRLYRSNTTANGQEVLQFLVELDIAALSYTDATESKSLGSLLESEEYDPPPSDLQSLTALPNGCLAGISKNQLCISEPRLPHAWPIRNRYTISATLKGLGVVGDALIIATDGFPYLARVADPSAMFPVNLETAHPCVAPQAMVDMGYSVVYPSMEGLVTANGGVPTLATEALLTEKQWRALNPTSMHAYRYQDMYVCFYDTGTVQGGLILDKRGQAFSFISTYATAGYTDPDTGDLYLVIAGAVQKWDANATAKIAYRWRSKVFDAPIPVCLAYAEVDAESYPVRLRLWADGALKFDADIAGRAAVPLPTRNTLAYRWQYEVAGTGEVRAVHIVQSTRELQG